MDEEMTPLQEHLLKVHYCATWRWDDTNRETWHVEVHRQERIPIEPEWK